VTISGPTYINEPGDSTWTTSVTPGTPPYTYQWWYKQLGGSWQLLSGETNSSYTRSVSEGQWMFWLKVVVTDSLDLEGEDTHVVDTPWGARIITAPPDR
jgi:hypothetical protein